MKKITEELINKRLEAKGFGEKQANDERLSTKICTRSLWL